MTRWFSRRVEDLATMGQAVAAYATRLGEKLRRERLGIDHVTVFYHTSEHDHGASHRSVSTTVILPEPTSDTLVLVRAATSGARLVWCDGHRYSKAGLITVDLVPLVGSQRRLPGMDLGDRETSARLMAALDACNRRFGRGAVVPGAAGMASKRAWSTRFDLRSLRYTTRLDELPVVSAADGIERQGVRDSCKRPASDPVVQSTFK